MKKIAGAIVIVGLAFVSVFAYTETNGEHGGGWAFLAFLVLFCWGWESTPERVETPWQREERRYYSGTKKDEL